MIIDNCQLFSILTHYQHKNHQKIFLTSSNCVLILKCIVDEKSKKFRLTLQFLEIDNIVRDIIYQYELESWRE
jgi:c-di-GMP-binding flagellar brake protein YcgR